LVIPNLFAEGRVAEFNVFVLAVYDVVNRISRNIKDFLLICGPALSERDE
jgi:hypothetical protein